MAVCTGHSKGTNTGEAAACVLMPFFMFVLHGNRRAVKINRGLGVS